MNYFFGLKSNDISSEINIPKFNYSNKKYFSNHQIFKATPKEDFWHIAKVNCSDNDDFFFIEKNHIDNNSIFFLSNLDELKSFFLNNKSDKLINLNNFTDNDPVEFRANLRLNLKDGGYSSYQSEYSYSMTTRNGNIMSPLHSLFNKDADKNLFIFRNIFFKPEINKYNLYLISLNENKILKQYDVFSNTTNIIEIDKKFICDDVFVFTEGLLGIPLYLSLKNNHLSLEHTHPPHHYIISEDRFKIVSNIKNRFKKIINEKNLKK